MTSRFQPARPAITTRRATSGQRVRQIQSPTRTGSAYADPQLEMPSGGGGGSVRSIARAYGALATGGSELGLSAHIVDALVAPPTPPSEGTHDLVMQADIRWSLGFMRPSPAFPFGTGLRSLGMPGLGGSFGYADLDAQVGYAYAPNKWRLGLFGDQRDIALRHALGRCLGDQEAGDDGPPG